MGEEESIFKGITLGFGALLGYFAGLDWELFQIWLLIMVSDVTVGVIFAKINGEYDSTINRKGLYMKVAEVITIFVLVLGQRTAIKYNINVPFSSAVTTLFIFKDIGSILETLTINHINLPPIITKWYENVLKELEKTDKHD